VVLVYAKCAWFGYSRIGSRTAVLTLGVASGQYSCPRLNTTVLGHNTGLISKHSFNNTIVHTSNTNINAQIKHYVTAGTFEP
jgi:hypothetical protein